MSRAALKREEQLAKLASGSASSASSSLVRKQLRVLGDNEWACSNAKCLFINTTKVRFCERCGKSMPRGKGQVGQKIGKEASEKSKGLFAAEDWACSKCGNINWARRTTCNICNAPKLGELEARTGYGGGYMDRQVVEYKERREDPDEDEFDEFGRKKKKPRLDEHGQEILEKEEPAVKQEEPALTDFKPPIGEGEEEEEDDDDEEDDEDLAKYDFGEIVAKGGVSPAHSYDSKGSCCSHSSCTCSGSTCYSSDPEGEEPSPKKSKHS